MKVYTNILIFRQPVPVDEYNLNDIYLHVTDRTLKKEVVTDCSTRRLNHLFTSNVDSSREAIKADLVSTISLRYLHGSAFMDSVIPNVLSRTVQNP